MANVIIKSDDQKRHEAQVLKSCGVDPETANKQQREYAQEIARKTAEIERSIKR